MSLPAASIQLGLLHDEAVVKERAEHVAREVEKLGTLRAGNSGILLPNGTTAGTCHRLTYLRYLGVEIEEHSKDRLIMFAAGNANEDYWARRLSTWKGRILREEEIPTNWTTETGIAVTGRPDMVLEDETGKQVLGIEHKMVASLWTAKTVAFERQPKLGHLIQAAHYMWQLGIPWKLVYTSYVDYSIPDWAGKMFQGNDALLEIGANGKPKKVLPFYRIYDLRTTASGMLQFSEEGANRWIDTPVSFDGIRNYYEYVSRIPSTGDLGERVSTLTSTGDKDGFNACSYCPLNGTCTKYGSDHDKWLSEVRSKATTIHVKEGM